MSYQRQTWQHEFEEKSELQLKEALVSAGWRSQRLKHDYGEDLLARQFKDGNPTGQDCYIQLKGTDDVQQFLIRKNFLSYGIELVNLKQWHSYSLPVILIVWDIVNRVGYWIHIQPFIQHKLSERSNWLENISNVKKPKRNIHIPIDQIIKENYIDSLQSVIEREWKKIKLGKSHFEILYKASGSKLEENFPDNLSPVIYRQLKITQSIAQVNINPDDLKSWLDLAALYYENHDFSAALKAINKVWEINKDARLIKQLKACILAEYAISHNNPPSMLYDAIYLFEESAEESDYLANYNIGNCYTALNQYDHAIEYFKRALEQNIESEQAAKIWNNYGNSLVKIGNYVEARSSFNTALSCNSQLWNTYSSLAHLEAKLGNHEDACHYFKSVFELNIEFEADENHLYCYVYSLCHLERYKEALENINKLLSIDPCHISGLAAKGQILANLRRQSTSFTNDALIFFKKRLLDEPSDLLARSELNLIYLDLGLDEERKALLKETVCLGNPPAMAFYEYAKLVEKDGYYVEAIGYLEKALAKERNHAILHALAKLYKKIENYSKAIEYYELTLASACNQLLVLSEISDCYYFMGDLKSDLLVITRAFLLDANGSYWWNNLFFVLSSLSIDSHIYSSFLLGLQELQIIEEKLLSKDEVQSKLDDFMRYLSDSSRVHSLS